jgi:hypothetical protein
MLCRTGEAMGKRLHRACIAGLLILTGTACLACDDARVRKPDETPNESGSCTENRVIESARRVTREYCSGTNGCDFNPRLEASVSDGQDGTDTSEEWIVIVSLIHSFGDAGQPRFMPEGARIVRVSTDCKPTGVLGHGGPIAIPNP